ncbi:MAG: hypothetical protein KDD45_01765, partial [Bdellovibrionales bacterium]|nr:hypothetical protein [Bdellovibrionales bacterium]
MQRLEIKKIYQINLGLIFWLLFLTIGCTSKKNHQTKEESNFLSPPEKYLQWVGDTTANLEAKLGSDNLKPNEKFWLTFHLFDLLKNESTEKSCQYLEQS